MHAGDWMTIVIAVLFVGFLIWWRIKVLRARKVAEPRRHGPKTSPVDGPDQEALIKISKVGSDGMHNLGQ
ncbi:MAG: hypothetical protein AAF557_02800 [Pseudomonadota bacterium]